MKDFILNYYQEIINSKNHRLKSWEHCYSQFSVMFKKDKLTNTDIDYLSLHLAFYLASWGMYRGSSFVLQKDYKVFYPIIELLFKNRDKFNDSKIKYLLNQENDESIKKYVKDYFVFDAELSKLLNEIRNSVKGETVTAVSDTLRTKIILGVYGSIPAYDRFLIDGMRASEDYDFTLSYSENGVLKLLEFAKERRDELAQLKDEIYRTSGITYPYMKLIDMYFWQRGYELGEDNKTNKYL